MPDNFGDDHEKGSYEVAFRRWMIRELRETKEWLFKESIERFNINPANNRQLIKEWSKKYAPEMVRDWPLITEKDRQKVETLQQRLHAAEQQLKHAQMKNIGLETLIDVAEDKLKISITKKAWRQTGAYIVNVLG